MKPKAGGQLGEFIDLSQYAKRGCDEELVRLGFDAIYEAYLPYVAAIGCKLLGRPEEVDDLIQDVFVQVLRRLGTLENPKALKGWIGKIATRRASRKLRWRTLRRTVGLDDHEAYTQVRYEGLDAEEHAMIAQVFRWLDEMPARWRIIWVFKHFEGKTIDEIAHLCDCSAMTVKRDLAKARQLIKEKSDESRDL